MGVDLDYLGRGLRLRNQYDVRTLRNDSRQVVEAQRQLVDSNHDFGITEINGSHGVANDQSSRVLLVDVDAVLEIQDDPIRLVQAGVQLELGLVTREVEARSAQPIARRMLPSGHGAFRPRVSTGGGTGPERRSLDSRRDHEWHGALVIDPHPRVLEAKTDESGAGRALDRISVQGSDLRDHLDLEAASVRDLHDDVQIGADIFARSTRFASARYRHSDLLRPAVQ